VSHEPLVPIAAKSSLSRHDDRSHQEISFCVEANGVTFEQALQYAHWGFVVRRLGWAEERDIAFNPTSKYCMELRDCLFEQWEPSGDDVDASDWFYVGPFRDRRVMSAKFTTSNMACFQEHVLQN
jgi:hypothetical protein